MNPTNIEITRIFPKYDQGSIWEILLFIWKLIFSNCKNFLIFVTVYATVIEIILSGIFLVCMEFLYITVRMSSKGNWKVIYKSQVWLRKSRKIIFKLSIRKGKKASELLNIFNNFSEEKYAFQITKKIIEK